VATDISVASGPQYNNAAFANTPALATFTLAPGGPGPYSVMSGGQALLKTEGSGLTLVFWPAASGAIVIPEGITKISAVAFRRAMNDYGNASIDGNAKITSVRFPASLVELETIRDVGAFSRCFGLTMVDMSAAAALTAINSRAFSGCTALNSVSFPPNLQSIGDYAFYACSAASFVEIDLPATVTSIGAQAFSACDGLTTLTTRAATPPALDASALPMIRTELIPDWWLGNAWEHFYVPSGSVDAYKSAENWSVYAEYIEAIPAP
jgi:hypothetical protein